MTFNSEIRKSNRRAHKLKLTLGQCERCIVSPAEDVHHIDSNPFNNEMSNLQALCRSCHHTVHSMTTVARDRKGRFEANQKRVKIFRDYLRIKR